MTSDLAQPGPRGKDEMLFRPSMIFGAFQISLWATSALFFPFSLLLPFSLSFIFPLGPRGEGKTARIEKE